VGAGAGAGTGAATGTATGTAAAPAAGAGAATGPAPGTGAGTAAGTGTERRPARAMAPMGPRGLVALGAMLFVCLVSRAAWATPATKRARALQRQAMIESQRGHHHAAVELLRKAHDAHPTPRIVLDLAAAYRASGRPALALRGYRAYLEARPRAANRAAVEADVAEVEALLTAQAKAERLEGEVALCREGDAPPSRPPPSIADLKAVEFETLAAEREPWHADKLAWTLTGAGVLVAGVGAGLILHAQRERESVAVSRELERADLRAGVLRKERIGVGALALGGALVTAGIVRLGLGARQARRPRVLDFDLALSPASVAIGGTF
jgi:hypothetical protein